MKGFVLFVGTFLLGSIAVWALGGPAWAQLIGGWALCGATGVWRSV